MTEKKSAGRTKTGVELTDDVLNRLAAEAETGLDLSKLRRRPGRPSMGSGPADTLAEPRFPVRVAPQQSTCSRGSRMVTSSPSASTSRRLLRRADRRRVVRDADGLALASSRR